MNALREILEEKLKDHRMNVGALGCQKAISQREKVCVELGLLRKEDQRMVKTLSEPLPVASSSQSKEIEEELDQEKTQDAKLRPTRSSLTIWHTVTVHV